MILSFSIPSHVKCHFFKYQLTSFYKYFPVIPSSMYNLFWWNTRFLTGRDYLIVILEGSKEVIINLQETTFRGHSRINLRECWLITLIILEASVQWIFPESSLFKGVLKLVYCSIDQTVFFIFKFILPLHNKRLLSNLIRIISMRGKWLFQ